VVEQYVRQDGERNEEALRGRPEREMNRLSE
jgi:hypothetical protein